MEGQTYKRCGSKTQVLVIAALFSGSILSLIVPAALAKELVYCRPNNMVSALAYVAEAQGFLGEEGLSIRFETATNFKICQDLILAGKADLSNGGDGPFTYIAGSQPPFKVLAVIDKNPEASIFVRADRGIHTVEDLKGRRVAWLPGTVSAFILSYMLSKHGLSLSDVQTVALQTPTMTQALIGGAVDAIVTWEPWGAQALAVLGERGLQIEDPQSRFLVILVASDRLIAAEPETIRALLRALLKAESHIKNHPAQTQLFLSKKIAFPAGILARYWELYDRRLRLDEEIVTVLQSRFKSLRLIDRNYADRPMPDFQRLIEARFLRALAPERVVGAFE